MNANFKINYKLNSTENIVPWGNEQKKLHWFGLTDSQLWIDAGESVIYEYSKWAEDVFGEQIKYNDYQLARFLEDFSNILPSVAVSVPELLYDSVETLSDDADKWKSKYFKLSDEEFDKFYDDSFYPLVEWFEDRSFNSGHLVGGLIIGCVRHEDKIKLFWKSDYLLENGCSIWKYPVGCIEMYYSEFVAEVTRFFSSFENIMDARVEAVIKDGIRGVFVDTVALKKENEARKNIFSQKVKSLSESNTSEFDWERVKFLYNKMIEEISGQQRTRKK